MKRRTRTYYTDTQKSDMWDRWQKGESLRSIGRVYDRHSSSIFGVLSPSGGIRPPERKRSRLALSLQEREEISRGLVTGLSLRTIASQLGRAPSTIS
jgi:DNA-binding NarL/FixJ family response regulator